MAGIIIDKYIVWTDLRKILRIYAPENVPAIPDGVLSFTYRMVMKLVSDCLTQFYRARISSEYLEHLQMNIRTLVQQAEERSRSGDLAFLKKVARKFLDVLEYMEPSLMYLETPDGDSKKGQQRNIADPNTSEPGLKTDLTEETTESSTADGGIPETPEIPESASAVIRSLNPMSKQKINNFTQIKVIGRGSYGVVQLVRHKDTNKVYAMKKQTRKHWVRGREIARTYLERDIGIFSDCPFVVSTLCCFKSKRHLCTVMEFEAGGDCGRLLKAYGRLPLDLARMYIAETVLAVEYLHSYGVVHRDLKPENLMISSTGHIKVKHFGLAKLGVMRPTSHIYKARTKDITREFPGNEMFGTLVYLAPEVIALEGYGRPIDWWAIGIILFKFLTGHVPFRGSCKKDIFRKIITDKITLKFKNRALHPDAENIMTQLLRKNPKHRLGTGGANEIKSHPFLSKLDFKNLQHQKPQIWPKLTSDEDTRYFPTGDRRLKPMRSDKGEVIDCPEGLNDASSSQRLSKLYATNTRMMSNEDHEPSPDSSPETSTKHSDVQKESSSTTSDGDSEYFSAQNGKSPSPILSVETKNTTALKLGEDQDPDIVAETEPSRIEKKNKSAIKLAGEKNAKIVEEREPRRRSIFRRIISSCRLPEKKNTSALKLGEEQNPELVAETEPSRVETKNTTALKLGEDQDPDIVAETEPSRIEKKNESAIKLAGEKTAKIVEEQEPRRRSIFRQIISSCRRGLSRAARSIRKRCIFPICH
ncbi:microtubule-associated serine/threonine-protein kinase 4-like isoform X2 [Ranitomeya variabilis]|uniref:microtubule-associated serine/threonine-protein kinase 4-like isoform X2 n=1 Tax=Ranitomeya variabilis TaxID=490064 RepID=UPI00405724B8